MVFKGTDSKVVCKSQSTAPRLFMFFSIGETKTRDNKVSINKAVLFDFQIFFFKRKIHFSIKIFFIIFKKSVTTFSFESPYLML